MNDLEKDIKILEEIKVNTKQACECSLASGSERKEWQRQVLAIENILADREKLEKEKNDAYWKGYIDKQNEAVELCKICKYKTKANKYDSLVDKIKERIKSVENCYEKEINKYYDESIKSFNVSCLNKKEKEEFINKRNCLIVQKATFEEVLELLDTEVE